MNEIVIYILKERPLRGIKLYNADLLIQAIVKLAVRDYKNSIKKYKQVSRNYRDKSIHYARLIDVDRFFVDGSFEFYTGLDGEEFYKLVQEEWGYFK